MAARQTPERRCRVCGAVLSQYNPNARCFPCQESGRTYLDTKREALYLTEDEIFSTAKLVQKPFSKKDILQRR
jgi:hypothetical protein